MRALVALLVIGGLLVGGDELVRSVAEGRVEEQIARELGGEVEVDVALGGFPFTVRALGGRIPSAVVTGSDIRRGPLTVASFSMSMQRLEVSLADNSARIEEGSGTATIDLESLRRLIERRTELIVVDFADNAVVARVLSIGSRVTAPIVLEGRRLVIDVPRLDRLSLPLPRLFRGVEYSALEISAAGAILDFEMSDTVLEASG